MQTNGQRLLFLCFLPLDLALNQLACAGNNCTASPIKHIVEYEYAYCRGQIVLFARLVDVRNQLGHRLSLGVRNFPDRVPERILETDTGPLSADDDAAFDDKRFHEVSRLAENPRLLIKLYYKILEPVKEDAVNYRRFLENAYASL
jgi:hypothetical protein